MKLSRLEIEPSHAEDVKSPALALTARTGHQQRENHSKAGPGVHPSLWRGRFEPITLIHVGWEARKAPVDAEVFFLDFSFYKTYQEQVFRVFDHPGFAA
jgi:hypothetical protein